ncbi:hypothetical protein N9N03_02900, partial [Chlamydiia bacterium]|nr:hypothetical protein [Chlamydiia bacterium]
MSKINHSPQEVPYARSSHVGSSCVSTNRVSNDQEKMQEAAQLLLRLQWNDFGSHTSDGSESIYQNNNDSVIVGDKHVMRCSNGYEYEYIGVLKNGKEHGLGKNIQTRSDGTVVEYEGNFVDGKRSGKGKTKFTRDGKVVNEYEGEYKNNKLHGPGKRIATCVNGLVREYEGDFVDGNCS